MGAKTVVGPGAGQAAMAERRRLPVPAPARIASMENRLRRTARNRPLSLMINRRPGMSDRAAREGTPGADRVGRVGHGDARWAMGMTSGNTLNTCSPISRSTR
ncbi:hypothetical protein GCM10017673_28690 [Streptosporangium violaceochromogenes]|nr:hypothetical protein GCM10017673_28690 [Streptosporangium violaceochromogenes]